MVGKREHKSRLDRTLQALDVLFGVGEPLTIRQISRRMNMSPKSNYYIQSMLMELVADGCVVMVSLRTNRVLPTHYFAYMHADHREDDIAYIEECIAVVERVAGKGCDFRCKEFGVYECQKRGGREQEEQQDLPF